MAKRPHQPFEYDATEFVRCPECGNEQADMGQGVKCEECGFGPMPCKSRKEGEK